MAKPFSKNQVGYMRHRKFLALNANAIALWHEGKDYCSEHLTDGLIPTEAVKGFRFRGAKAVDLLTSSCGSKPDGAVYAPLWEQCAIGFKMHDYLEHNDSYEVVQARIKGADDVREVERKRKADWRALQAERRTGADRREQPRDERGHFRAVPVGVPPGQHGAVPVYTEPVPSTTPLTKERLEGGEATASPPRPRPMAPIHDRSHREHAECGRICIHASQFGEFVRRRNHPRADSEIRAWVTQVIDSWTHGLHANDEPGDLFDFWRARYAETWPASAAAGARKHRLDIVPSLGTPGESVWNRCPHDPKCTSVSRCEALQTAEPLTKVAQ